MLTRSPQILAASALSSSSTVHAQGNHASSSNKQQKEDASEALANITRNLDTIVDGLVNEQSTLSSDDAGPCLEYVVGYCRMLSIKYHADYIRIL